MRHGISADNAYLAVFLKVILGDASGEKLSEVIVNQVFYIRTLILVTTDERSERTEVSCRRRPLIYILDHSKIIHLIF